MVTEIRRGLGNVVTGRVPFLRDAQHVPLGHRHPENGLAFRCIGLSFKIVTQRLRATKRSRQIVGRRKEGPHRWIGRTCVGIGSTRRRQRSAEIDRELQ